MQELVNEYYELIKLDKEYVRKHEKIKERDENFQIYNNFLKIVNDFFRWRTINDKETLKDIIINKDRKDIMELLRIEDYYSDELGELLSEYLKVDFSECEDEEIEKIFSKENLNKLLDDSKTPIQIKECIKISAKSNEVCSKFLKYIQG